MSWKKKSKMSNKKVKVPVINQPAKDAASNLLVKGAGINFQVKSAVINQPVKVTAINQPAKDLAIINQPVIDLSKLQKWQQNIEIISKFIEKTPNRHNVRTKLFEILFSYLSQIILQLSVPAKNKLHLKLMKVLGFYILYFFISIFILMFSLLFNFVLFNRFPH
jgi:hypothetical protein